MSDITHLLGTSSVPVVVAGSVLGVFELGEKLASQRAKDALSKWLLTFDVQKAKAAPIRTDEHASVLNGEMRFRFRDYTRKTSPCSLGISAWFNNPWIIVLNISLWLM